MSGKKILVIPDTHARPDMDNSRFDALGNFIVEKRPDIVISIGDWYDMASLCSYDKATLHAEGRRYQADIDAGNDALLRVMTKVRRGYNKKKLPEFHVTLGNHEERILRAANQNPELAGKLSYDDFHFKKYGWHQHDFLKPLVKENICFMHYLPSGPMKKAVGGVNAARTLVLKGMMSVVVGHSHTRDYWETSRIDGQKMFGLAVGCYDEGDHVYANGTQQNWWSGLVMLHEAQDGSAEPAFFSMDYVKRKFK